jgi:hypothetical protein
VVGFRERSKAPSGSIKNGEFLTGMSTAEEKRRSMGLTGLHTKTVNLWMLLLQLRMLTYFKRYLLHEDADSIW